MYVHLTVLKNVEYAFDLLLVDTASILYEAVFVSILWCGNTRFQLTDSRAKRTVSTELIKLFCRASNISTTDPFRFIKQKQETVEVFLEFLFTNMRSSDQCAQNENSSAIKTATQS